MDGFLRKRRADAGSGSLCGGGAGSARPVRLARAALAAAAALLLAAAVFSAAVQAASGARLVMPLGWGITRVLSGSMEPTFSAGSLLLVRELGAADAPSVGDIVVYDAGDGLVAHRVVELREGEIVARGDANNVSDAPISPSQVKGEVVAWTPSLAQGGLSSLTASASASYATAFEGADAARVAFFGWDCMFYLAEDSPTGFAESRRCSIDFVVSNVRDGRVGEVSQNCRFEFWVEGGTPLEITLSDSETSEVAGSFLLRSGDPSRTLSPASAYLPAAEETQKSYRLDIVWPEDGGSSGPLGYSDVVNVAVIFEQADPDGEGSSQAAQGTGVLPIAQVGAKYLQREVFPLLLTCF